MYYTIQNPQALTNRRAPWLPFTTAYLVRERDQMELASNYEAVLTAQVNTQHTRHWHDMMELDRVDGRTPATRHNCVSSISLEVPDLFSEEDPWRWLVPLLPYRSPRAKQLPGDSISFTQRPYGEKNERERVPLVEINMGKTRKASLGRCYDPDGNEHIAGIDPKEWLFWPALIAQGQLIDPVCTLCPRHPFMTVGECTVGDSVCLTYLKAISLTSLHAKLREADELLSAMKQEIY